MDYLTSDALSGVLGVAAGEFAKTAQAFNACWHYWPSPWYVVIKTVPSAQMQSPRVGLLVQVAGAVLSQLKTEADEYTDAKGH